MIKKLLAHKYSPLLIISLFALMFTFFFYARIILHPNDYMFSPQGDGIKNYFTYSYHIKHDQNYFEFQGMNYPYGESILYTDCHPALALTFKALAEKAPFFETHAVGLLNLIMILSVFLSFIVCYCLLSELGLKKWHSVFFAVTMTVLAPQIFRMGGHYALSYSIAIPLSWWLIIKLSKGKRWMLPILFVNILFWLFIHAYLGMIIIAFLLSYLLVEILLHPEKKKRALSQLRSVIVLLAPLALYYTLNILTDTHEGRTDNPSGFFLYNAELDDVFLPNSIPLNPLVDNISGNTIKQEWEAWGYVGLSATLLALIIAGMAIFSICRKPFRKKVSQYFDHRQLNISLIAAMICLLFAMAFPFKFIPSLLEYVPFLKQFRATGRFVWPFYFVFTALAAYTFSKLAGRLHSKEKPVYAMLFLAVIIGFNLFEGLPYHSIVSKDITRGKNIFSSDMLDNNHKEALEQIVPDEYQAILPLPFFCVGSENYTRLGTPESLQNTMVISYHTGLPIFGNALARTSVEESKRMIQVLTPNYYAKPIKNDIPNDKPFLIVCTKNPLTPYEDAIYSKGELIESNKHFELLKITPGKLFADERQNVADQFHACLPQLQSLKGFFVTDSTTFLYYDDYESAPSPVCFRGNGSYQSVKKGANTFTEFPPNTFQKDKTYHFSLWMYNGEPDALNLWFRVLIEEKNEETGNFRLAEIFPDQAETIAGNWSLIEADFSVHNPSSTISIISKGKENSKASLHADDLLIRESGVDVYRWENADSSSLFYNNHHITIPF